MNGNPQDRLDSWKEIAAFLRRDVRTAQRWEKKEGLPVHRHQHDKLGSIYAFRAELAEWFNTRQQAAPSTAGGKIKLAVLPFENLGGNQEDRYFSEGLTEEMTTEITRLQPEALAVIARSTAEHYESTQSSLEKMKRDLGVDYVLEGKVRRSGNRVRITVRLSEIEDQTQMWAETYERDLGDVLGVQAEIAQAVAAEINLALNLTESKRLAGLKGGKLRVKPEAYDTYLRARYHLHAMTPAGMRQSVEEFQRAVALDPAYPPAQAGLASAWALLAIAPFDLLPPREAMPKAEVAARKSLELDEGLAEAHAALALIQHHYHWHWKEAEAEYRRAIELNPGYADAHLWYSWLLLALNRRDEALQEIEKTMTIVQETDPHRLVAVHATRALAYYFGREFERAVEECEKALHLDPSHFMLHFILGRAYRRLGQGNKAIMQLQAARKVSSELPLVNAVLGLAYAVSGKKEQAQQVVDSLRAAGHKRYIPPTYFGILYAGLGDKDQALAWMEKAYEERADLLTWLNVEPMMDDVRGDPRFLNLIRRIGLVS
ncbi:MAG TPA: tetratricopeptide repeat protein [Candidatus Angelobacter sp.]|nr:tetratricopeptide repeat protein [Candidatus Angelobacter sp.]